MQRELPVKQDDFSRLLTREAFLWNYFNCRLNYRIPSRNNGYIYVEVVCDDGTNVEDAEQYIKSYLQPKHSISITCPLKSKEMLMREDLINRLMKEYLVHIDLETDDHSYQINFHSLTLTVLYLAIDNFDKYISTHEYNDPTILDGTRRELANLSDLYERELSIINEQDPITKEESAQDNTDVVQDDSDEEVFTARQDPPLTIDFPGAKPQTREVKLEEFLKPEPTKNKKKNRNRRTSQRTTNNDDSNRTDNDLIRELRQKLNGRNLRHVIIDGANIGRTYGGAEFSSRGVKLAIDHFRALGFPDSKLTVIVPAHYLSKDRDHVFPDLLRRKILQQAFHQKIDNELKRFYDDRFIVELAVVRQGVIVSNDFYRDIFRDSGDAVRKAIRERLLCYRFVGDDLFLPNPVHEGGAKLEDFLSQ